MSKFSIDTIKEWFNPQMKVDPRRIPAVPPPPLISQSQTQAVEVQEEIPEPYTAQPPLYVESHARQEPAPEMMIYQHPVQPPPMMMVDTHTQYLDQAPGGYVQVMQQPQQHFSIAPVQYMYQPEVVTQQVQSIPVSYVEAPVHMQSYVSQPIQFYSTDVNQVYQFPITETREIQQNYQHIQFASQPSVVSLPIAPPIISQPSAVTMTIPEVQANFVGNTQVQALANDDGTDALMARIDRTLAEANRTLELNSADHAGSKYYYSEQTPDYVDGIKV